jgi:hypothetical protein
LVPTFILCKITSLLSSTRSDHWIVPLLDPFQSHTSKVSAVAFPGSFCFLVCSFFIILGNLLRDIKRLITLQ